MHSSVEASKAYLNQIQPRNFAEFILHVQRDLHLALASLHSHFEMYESFVGTYGDIDAIRNALKSLTEYIDTLPTCCVEHAEPHPTFHSAERPVYNYFAEFLQYGAQIDWHVEFIEWEIKNIGVLSLADEQQLYHLDQMSITARRMADQLQALNIYHHEHLNSQNFTNYSDA